MPIRVEDSKPRALNSDNLFARVIQSKALSRACGLKFGVLGLGLRSQVQGLVVWGSGWRVKG